MQTFFMLGKYSSEAFAEMGEERTEKVISLIKKLGGEVKSVYALLGEYDLVFIVNFLGVEQVMKASIILNKLTGISFVSSPAVEVEQFDKILKEIYLA